MHSKTHLFLAFHFFEPFQLTLLIFELLLKSSRRARRTVVINDFVSSKFPAFVACCPSFIGIDT